MNDQILLENILLLLKSTTEVFVHGTLESSNKEIHNALKNGLDEILKMQSEVYTKMTEYGWYKLDNVETKKINQALTKLTSNN